MHAMEDRHDPVALLAGFPAPEGVEDAAPAGQSQLHVLVDGQLVGVGKFQTLQCVHGTAAPFSARGTCAACADGSISGSDTPGADDSLSAHSKLAHFRHAPTSPSGKSSTTPTQRAPSTYSQVP